MDLNDLAFESGTGLARLIGRKQVSPVELVQAYLERIDRFDPRLRAFITVCPDAALEAARRAESQLLAGEAFGPLHGVSFAVKDQIDTRGVRTTQGSRLFVDAVPREDATVVTRLRNAGAILLGKLNLTEFALGGTQDFPFGQPRNPWKLEHDPGGSSSGSGIAAAAALTGVSAKIPGGRSEAPPPGVEPSVSAPPGAGCRAVECFRSAGRWTPWGRSLERSKTRHSS